MLHKLISHPLFWLVLTIGFFTGLAKLQANVKLKSLKPFLNPLLLTIALIIVILFSAEIPYENYEHGGNLIAFFISPATVALAIKLEKNFSYLKNYFPAIVTGIVAGVLAHTLLIFLLAYLFQFDLSMVATLYPKSITTAIAVGVSESLGGIASLTVAVVVFTGVVGAVIGEPLLKLFKVQDKVAQGVALGMSAHAMGTAKAIQMGEVQGAMSGLSIVITGITVVIMTPAVGPLMIFLFN